jgi:hypothetical protein
MHPPLLAPACIPYCIHAQVYRPYCIHCLGGMRRRWGVRRLVPPYVSTIHLTQAQDEALGWGVNRVCRASVSACRACSAPEGVRR